MIDIETVGNHEKPISILLVIFNFSICYGQAATIFFNNEKIICSVREITPDAVKYAYAGDEVTNSIYKNAIQKIAYQDGKVQTFSESASLKVVNCLYDYNNVTINQVESEIHGLFKLGDVSSLAKGGSAFGSGKVKERAMRKLKILAAMEGANVVYLTGVNNSSYQHSRYNSYPASTNLVGVAYASQVPNVEEFEKAISNKTEFTAIQETRLYSRASKYIESPIRKQFKLIRLIR